MRDRPTRADFGAFRPVTTRWADNDVYGHVNNAVHYGWFDSAVNAWLIEAGLVSVRGSGPIFLVAETGCRYFAPLAYPQPVEIGLQVERVGSSSVTWRLGAFASGGDLAASAGRFVHVRVDRETRRPVPLDAAATSALAALAGPTARDPGVSDAGGGRRRGGS